MFVGVPTTKKTAISSGANNKNHVILRNYVIISNVQLPDDQNIVSPLDNEHNRVGARSDEADLNDLF